MNTRWLKDMIIMYLFIVVFGLIILGAIHVTLGMNHQLKNIEKTRQTIRSWHEQIALEVPLAQKQSWNHLGNEYPLKLLTACTIEEKAMH